MFNNSKVKIEVTILVRYSTIINVKKNMKWITL